MLQVTDFQCYMRGYCAKVDVKYAKVDVDNYPKYAKVDVLNEKVLIWRMGADKIMDTINNSDHLGVNCAKVDVGAKVDVTYTILI